MVSYDPNRDLAILDVPNLQATVTFAAEEAKAGSDAILLGYPEGGDLAAIPARIREVIQLDGPDIYRTTTVSREVYTIRRRRERRIRRATHRPRRRCVGDLVRRSDR